MTKNLLVFGMSIGVMTPVIDKLISGVGHTINHQAKVCHIISKLIGSFLFILLTGLKLSLFLYLILLIK